MSSLKKKIGIKVKELRQAKGLKQHELGELVGLDPCSISRIEVGGNFPSFESLEKMGVVFNCPLSTFFEFEKCDQKSLKKEKLVNLILSASEIEIDTLYDLICRLK